MAFDGDTLGSAIASAIEGVTGGTIVGTQSEDIWKVIAGEILDHITANGVVSTVVTTPDTINGTGTGSIA